MTQTHAPSSEGSHRSTTSLCLEQWRLMAPAAPTPLMHRPHQVAILRQIQPPISKPLQAAILLLLRPWSLQPLQAVIHMLQRLRRLVRITEVKGSMCLLTRVMTLKDLSVLWGLKRTR